MTAEPRDELHRLVEEIVMAPGWREALRAAVAAADRENAELRGEVERLRELVRANAHAVLTFERERNSARAQLAAAQAQLAEAEALLSTMGDTLAAAEARLEAVRALHRSDAYARPTCLGCGREWPCPTEEAMQAAALSAAPQPEPVDELGVELCPDCGGSGNATTFDGDDLGVCSTCRGTGDPEPPASDEPARCAHGETAPHNYRRPASALLNVCGGPSAHPAPECRHCNGTGIAHTFDGAELGICGTCHGTGSAAGGGL